MGAIARWSVLALLVACAVACGSVVDEANDVGTEFSDTGDGGGEVPADIGDLPLEDARPESGREDTGIEDVPVETEDVPEAEAGCTSAAECDDGNPCNGAEDCVGGECRGGAAPADGTPCEREGGEGICRGGVCAAPGCGDGVLTAPEECDDGNEVSGDGCEPDCEYSCHSNTDCADDNPCSVDACEANEIGRICRHSLADPGAACDDEDPCTVEDRCSATGVCAGEDRSCNDGNECTVDTCDRSVPDDPCVHAALPNWYLDGDGDGWGDGTRWECGEAAPSDDWISRAGDCCDSAFAANPDQTGYFGEPYTCIGSSGSTTTSYDYNCSGISEQHWPTAASGCVGASCTECYCTSGWCPSSWPDPTGTCGGVARCGETSAWVLRCEWTYTSTDAGTLDSGTTDFALADADDDSGTSVRICAPVLEMRRQLCH